MRSDEGHGAHRAFRLGERAGDLIDGLSLRHGDEKRRAVEALRNYPILGIQTNVAFLIQLLEHPRFIAGDIDTRFLDVEGTGLRARAPVPSEALEVAEALRATAAGSTATDPWDTLRGYRG